MEILSERLKLLREKEGLSQVQLATDLGIGAGFLANVERGAKSVSIKTLIKISDYFNVTPDYLLGFKD